MWRSQAQLDENTASLAEGYDAVCLFVNDICGKEVRMDCKQQGSRACLHEGVMGELYNVDAYLLMVSSLEKARLDASEW